MIAGFLLGALFVAGAVYFMNPCPHTDTEYVSKCIRCGKIFNDGLSEMRRRNKS